MAADFDLWDRIPQPLAEVLINLVTMAEKSGSLTIGYSDFTGLDAPGRSYSFSNKNIPPYTACLPGDLLLSLECLEFIKKEEKPRGGGFVFLTLRALEWAEYQRSNWFIKWWTRSREHVRDIGLVVIGLLTVGLTVIQILEALM